MISRRLILTLILAQTAKQQKIGLANTLEYAMINPRTADGKELPSSEQKRLVPGQNGLAGSINMRIFSSYNLATIEKFVYQLFLRR